MIGMKAQSIRSMRRVQKARKALERIAYGSLIIDILISLTTLVSLQINSFSSVNEIIELLSYALTAIVMVSLALFLEILLITHYQKLSETFLLLNGRLRKSIRKIYPYGNKE